MFKFGNQKGKSGFENSEGIVNFPDDAQVTFLQTIEERLQPLFDYRLKLILDITDETPKVSDEHVESMKQQIKRIEEEIMLTLIGKPSIFYAPLDGDS